MVNGVFAGFQDKAAVAAVRIFQNASAPVARRHMGNRQVAMPRTLPPIEFDDFREAKIGDQIGNMSGNDDGRCNAAGAQIVLHDGAQRRTMQMIEVSVRNQHHIDGRKIGDAQARPAQALQHEEPARKVGIDDHTLAANLHEEAGVANKGDPELSVDGKSRLVSFTAAWSYRRTPHQTSELGGALAKRRIAKCLPNHPATEPWGLDRKQPALFILVLIAGQRGNKSDPDRFYLPAINLR